MVVTIDARTANNIGNLHIVSIGIRLFNAGFRVTTLRKLPKKASLFHSMSEANDFVEK